MRDPKRIKVFCDKLAEVWERECPDWRFGQMIYNVFGGSDPFFVEDDKCMQRIERYFKKVYEVPEDTNE